MAVKWTAEQQRVIDTHNENLLVSAAAGSGKTAVLVARILAMITNPQHPVDIDRLLVVTFTNAAAAEMRGRIRDALEARAQQDPDNEHLQRQLVLVHNAKITTIHSFCLQVLRSHFQTAGIDPSFRIADEGEVLLLEQDAVQETVNAAYEEASPQFTEFLERLATGREDREIEQLILQLYHFALGQPFPEEWLVKCRAMYGSAGADRALYAEETQSGGWGGTEHPAWLTFIEEETARRLADIRAQIEAAMAIALEPDGPYPYEKALAADLELVDALAGVAGICGNKPKSGITEKNGSGTEREGHKGSAHGANGGRQEKGENTAHTGCTGNKAAPRTWAEYAPAFAKMGAFVRLSPKKDPAIAEEKKQRVQAMRAAWKDELTALREQYYYDSPAVLQREFAESGLIVRELTRLTEDFMARIAAKKTEKNVLDFSDLEHFALKILVERDPGQTAADTGDAAAERKTSAAGEMSVREAPDTVEAEAERKKSVTGEMSAREASGIVEAAAERKKPETGEMSAREAPDTVEAEAERKKPVTGEKSAREISGAGAESVKQVSASDGKEYSDRNHSFSWRPTAAAREYAENFFEIMTDEYQDSNLVQEMILSSIAGAACGAHNRFMVGDVKQSIYRFRLARPELFMEKYRTYRTAASQPDAGEAGNSGCGDPSAASQPDAGEAGSSGCGAWGSDSTAMHQSDAAGTESCNYSTQGDDPLVMHQPDAAGTGNGTSIVRRDRSCMPDSSPDTAGETGLRIDLHRNFRSRRQVLAAVNGIFRQIMTESPGGIKYDADAALYQGASFPEAPPGWQAGKALTEETEHGEKQDMPGEASEHDKEQNVSGEASEHGKEQAASRKASEYGKEQAASGEAFEGDKEQNTSGEVSEGDNEQAASGEASEHDKIPDASSSWYDMELLLADGREAALPEAPEKAGESSEKKLGSYESGEKRRPDSSEYGSANSAAAEEESAEDSSIPKSLREAEARLVGRKILELNGTMPVLDKETGGFRPARFGDIVILLRTVSGWAETFGEVLSDMGIPCFTGSQKGYFSAAEIRIVLSYLRILDNPLQDIPLAAVLRSAIGEFGDEELSQIRLIAPEEEYFWDCCRSYRENGDQAEIRKKLEKFFGIYEGLRAKCGHTPVHLLLWELLDVTGYGEYAAALPGGRQRQANLDMLVEKAISYEATSYRGLYHFVRYIESLQKYEVDFGEASPGAEAEHTVRIMSIHKSKGLEFPIVFVSGLGKRFNESDSRSRVVMHPDWGIGCDCVDTALRTRQATLLKRMIQRKTVTENLGEELRVLYVAMTRAKEKLILTGGVRDPEKSLAAWRSDAEYGGETLSYSALSGASSYLDWVMPALLRSGDGQNGSMKNPNPEKLHFTVRFVSAREQIAEKTLQTAEDLMGLQELLNLDPDVCRDEQAKKYLEQIFAAAYPYEKNREIPGKVSVSELKKLSQTPEEPDAAELYPSAARFLSETGGCAVIETASDMAREKQSESGKAAPAASLPYPESGPFAESYPESSALAGQSESGMARQSAAAGKNAAEKQNSAEFSKVVPLVPSFIRTASGISEPEPLRGAARGTAYHTFMENLDFTGKETLSRQLEEMISCGKLSREEAGTLRLSDFRTFLKTGLAARMECAQKAGLLYREQPFVLGVPANRLRKDWDARETVLIQGIIDAYFIENGGIILLDYKTDHVSDGKQLTERYQAQIDYYAEALNRLTGYPVREKLIYSFWLGRTLTV